MKKVILSIAFSLLFIVSYAQKNVTTFLGIPVDGYKSEMQRALEAKGFKYDKYEDCLKGEFNGSDVRLHIVTNNNKVYRILVEDKNYVSETDIIIRFNHLCRQFDRNSKYTKISDNTDYTIGEDEDIAYEMLIHNKRYQATYFQDPNLSEKDSIQIYNTLKERLSKKFDLEIFNPEYLTEKQAQDYYAIVGETVYEYYTKKTVWFMINEKYGKYQILMYYDNGYNQADGEDL